MKLFSVLLLIGIGVCFASEESKDSDLDGSESNQSYGYGYGTKVADQVNKLFSLSKLFDRHYIIFSEHSSDVFNCDLVLKQQSVACCVSQ